MSARGAEAAWSRAAAGGQLDQGEAEMLSGVFHLHEQEAAR